VKIIAKKGSSDKRGIENKNTAFKTYENRLSKLKSCFYLDLAVSPMLVFIIIFMEPCGDNMRGVMAPKHIKLELNFFFKKSLLFP